MLIFLLYVEMFLKNLNNYLNHSIELFKQSISNFKIIASNTTAKLAGFPAYSLEYTGVYNSPYTELELGTIVSGNRLLYVEKGYYLLLLSPPTRHNNTCCTAGIISAP
jgi:hypothetical protein